ncbi:MAG: beta-ketoacyl-ACP synthase 3 [Planctomycetota bacterium]
MPTTSARQIDTRLDRAAWLGLYRAMATARRVDELELELAAAGEAFFQIAGTGHEPAAVLDLFLQPSDWVHGHYRDKALMIARGIGPKAWFDSVLTTAGNYSHGRQMCCFMASRELRLPSTVIPVANHCLHACGIADRVKDEADRPVVLCGIGDGSTQQGEFYEAVGEAVRERLPVLFYVEDNGVAISTQTAGKTFFDLVGADGERVEEFMGLPIHRFDGHDLLNEAAGIGAVVDGVRESRGPGLMVLRVERLRSHSNADDQRVYRTAEQIEALRETRDGLAVLRRGLIDSDLEIDASALEEVDGEVDSACRSAMEESRRIGDPIACLTAKPELPAHLQRDAEELHPVAKRVVAASNGTTHSNGSVDADTEASLTMIEAMRGVLRHALENDAEITLFGQDIEDPKGDVFGVTKGLSTDFPERVKNAPLAESTIIGKSIGQALAGGKPVAFIQFADFLPNGISQVMSELGSMWWRTGGEFSCPVLLMITCGGYRPGLGPFHSHTHEATLAHVPGLDVMMPSNAADAAGMLRAALESDRPTAFLYPKVCLNDRHPETVAAGPAAEHLVPMGKARSVRSGDDLTLVAWGSTVSVARDVADTIVAEGVGSVEVLDLRCIVPWDRPGVVASAKRTGRLLVVHEDNLTAGFGAEVVAAVSEDTRGHDVAVRRLTRPDTYVPCNFPNQLEVLPSYRRTLAAACEMLGVELSWEEDEAVDEAGLMTIEAPAPSPADQAVTIGVYHVKVGDTVDIGEPLLDVEADKAAHEVASPARGVVEALLIEEGENVPVGTPMMRLRTESADAGDAVVKRINREDKGRPRLSRPDVVVSDGVSELARSSESLVYLSPIQIAEGSNRLPNSVLVQRFQGREAEDIVKRTGIESRPILAPKESALSIAVEAARKALDAEGLELSDVTGIVCHTTTPPANTPSMACLILNELDPDATHECMVYDVNAACSGWLYAIDTAYHTALTRPDSVVLVVTTEALSRVVDPTDFDTAILFGDAATATILRAHQGEEAFVPPVSGDGEGGLPYLRMQQPVLSGKADAGSILTVGFQGQAPIAMDGKKVFAEGVRAMTMMTEKAFAAAGLTIEELDYLVPHQANRRIMEAVRKRLRIPPHKVVDLIADHGNTSSSTIPLAIAKTAHGWKKGESVGVCAFGGGFTFGASVLHVL